MLFRLLLLFTLVPLAELALLLWVADRTSWLFTLTLVIVTGVLGAALARNQGFRCVREIQQRTARGELPAAALVDGLMILVAGAVLITPGILTDLLGFSLLMPPVRRLFRRWLIHRFRGNFTVHTGQDIWRATGRSGPDEGDVIDAEYREPGRE